MTLFWVFVWLVCAGIALFGDEEYGYWSAGRKIAAFIAFGPIVAIALLFGGIILFG